MKVTVIGGGLAGSEAAYYLASHGIQVTLVEMKPKKFTPAHESADFGELVCSNSLKSNDIYANACGLLKEEMRMLGSLVIEAADHTRVPAGAALAVDRAQFSGYITKKIREHENITVVEEEITSLPEPSEEEFIVVATGPLTADALSKDICEKLGGALHFYDASAPIVSADSIDYDCAFTGDRYGKGTGDYINCPMTKEEYELFVDELLKAEKVELHEFEKREIFEGCMPIEVMASRGKDTLRYGTLKPVGLYDEDGKRPYAVLQLRKENEEGTTYNLVGFQTNLKFPEQKRVFSMIPALKNAEFLRYGVMHRNTYINAPTVLNSDFSMKEYPTVFFAGQITGVEGYVESTASGLLAAINMDRKLSGKESLNLDSTTVLGALSCYVATPNEDFQPMNANFGIIAPIEYNPRKKAEKKLFMAQRALQNIKQIKENL